MTARAATRRNPEGRMSVLWVFLCGYWGIPGFKDRFADSHKLANAKVRLRTPRELRKSQASSR